MIIIRLGLIIITTNYYSKKDCNLIIILTIVNLIFHRGHLIYEYVA